MNYLAHAFLSFEKKELVIGNLISDFVKGRKKYDYSVGIQQGIALHRAIDEFTDNHTITQKAKLIFKPAAGSYAGAFLDISYDHFLATDKKYFDSESLLAFSQSIYDILMQEKMYPEKFSQVLPHMIRHNWLYNYQFEYGIEKSFEGLVKRAAYLNEYKPVFELFKKNYTLLSESYYHFFDELYTFAHQFAHQPDSKS